MQKIFISFINTLVVLSLVACSGTNNSDSQAVDVKLIAVNDFHGRLKTDPTDSGATVTVADSASSTGVSRIKAGGAAFLATLVSQLRASNNNSMVIAAGDIIGASQPISGLTSEEASIDVMSRIGLEVTAVGNHEFDKGKAELQRMQNGGCKSAADGGVIGQTTCITNSQSRADGKFAGAKFKYLAANVIDQATNQQLFQGTYTKQFGNAKVGFVGLTLQATPTSTSGAGGLTFLNEATVINENAAQLKKEGADAVVVLIHQGGQTSAPYINDQSCPGLTGLISGIVSQLHNVDVVVSGHTHQEYICRDAATGILLTSAGLYGRMVTDIDLKIVPGKGVTAKTARTVPVINNLNSSLPQGYQALTADAATQAIIDIYDRATSGTLQQVYGYTNSMLSNCNRTQTLETPVGDMEADAYLDSYLNTDPSATNVIAFTNVGGLRTSISYVNGGEVTYDALYSLAPFGNSLVYLDMTGAQVKRLLEQQWEATNCAEKRLPSTNVCGRLLQPSSTLRYTWNWGTNGVSSQGQPDGQGSLLTSVEIRNGNTWTQISDTATYRVVTNAFMASGGDKFSVFTQVEPVDFGVDDLMALTGYFQRNTTSTNKLPNPWPSNPSSLLQNRASCLNCPPLQGTDPNLCQQ